MKRDFFIYFILSVVLLLGIGLMLYPSVSNYMNKIHQSKAIADYSATVDNMDGAESQRMLEDARAFNSKLDRNNYVLSEERMKDYLTQISIGSAGVMGYLEVPSVNISLPIYHTTQPEFLQIGVGHLEWSSLPVGGNGTHCFLSGHRGLPSAKLFTDLDRVAEGDVMLIRVLDEVLTYEVDQILIVEPTDTSVLQVEEEGDYLTLLTCTPYGINSHRMLVRGHRIANAEEVYTVRVTADATLIDAVVIAPIMSVPLILLMLFFILAGSKSRNG